MDLPGDQVRVFIFCSVRIRNILNRNRSEDGINLSATKRCARCIRLGTSPSREAARSPRPRAGINPYGGSHPRRRDPGVRRDGSARGRETRKKRGGNQSAHHGGVQMRPLVGQEEDVVRHHALEPDPHTASVARSSVARRRRARSS